MLLLLCNFFFSLFLTVKDINSYQSINGQQHTLVNLVVAYHLSRPVNFRDNSNSFKYKSVPWDSSASISPFFLAAA